ncbi:hypothetical protein BT93_L5226 [Corymbia citriodora subsp. variegata]|uniref:ER membrane protein complex subunit 2 n=1 Tax=Corymbia citriodora subsp. variegata TaxID=360336 RepID=A0A8T0CK07_CORYI|nr:hypothetical protein BT93_L5226 [Corymbia citriodora subsp. variegata]
MALRGLYQEAVAKDEVELRAILQSYNEMLRQDPMNVPIHKRRTALICSVGRYVDAIDCLVSYLNSFPGDAESWCELADLYQDQGMISQAIYCMEEAILLQPNAWNLHARLGELNYVASQSSSDGVSSTIKHLSEAVHRLSRSIELCQDYLRGYYGLKLATDKLLQLDLGKVNELCSKTKSRIHDLTDDIFTFPSSGCCRLLWRVQVWGFFSLNTLISGIVL